MIIILVLILSSNYCRCDNGQKVKIPAVESYVMVLQPQQPSISISGSSNVAREYRDFRGGVRVFPDLKITVEREQKQRSQSKYFSIKIQLKNSLFSWFS